MPSVAVIIVNYRVAELAVQAVESVRTHAPGTRVHLVDNASGTDDADLLSTTHAARGWGDAVELHLETTNHGFGRGNNLVFDMLSQHADPPDYVFLLNPDAVLKNDAISVLKAFLEDSPKAVAAGARIEKPGGVPVTAAFRFPSIASEFAAATAFGPISRLFRRWQVALTPDHPMARVDWVAGAAVMMRFDVVRTMGGFDPAFFLYYEEVELMQRFNRTGHEVWYVPSAEVIHLEGASTNVRSGESKRKRRPPYLYYSWQYYFRKTHGRGYALAAGIAWISGAILNHAIARLFRREPAAPLNLFGDFWRSAGRPLLGIRTTMK